MTDHTSNAALRKLHRQKKPLPELNAKNGKMSDDSDSDDLDILRPKGKAGYRYEKAP